MKNLFYISLIAISSLTLFSCNKEDDGDHHDDVNSAVITLTSPAVGGTINHGDTLKVRGTIVSVLDMHGYSVSIKRNTTDTAAVFYFNDHYHGSNKNLNVNWPCDLHENVELAVTVKATLDHDGNSESKTVYVQCQQ